MFCLTMIPCVFLQIPNIQIVLIFNLLDANLDEDVNFLFVEECLIFLLVLQDHSKTPQ